MTRRKTRTQKRIMIDSEKCAACYNCVIACKLEHSETAKTIDDLDLTSLKEGSRNHIEITDENKAIPIICRHCNEPECVYTCMSGAMTKDPDTGYVLHDKEKCASCLMCVMSCPFGALKVDHSEKKLIMKCDMCTSTRSMVARNPACVESCPTGAIYIIEVPI